MQALADVMIREMHAEMLSEGKEVVVLVGEYAGGCSAIEHLGNQEIPYPLPTSLPTSIQDQHLSADGNVLLSTLNSICYTSLSACEIDATTLHHHIPHNPRAAQAGMSR